MSLTAAAKICTDCQGEGGGAQLDSNRCCYLIDLLHDLRPHMIRRKCSRRNESLLDEIYSWREKLSKAKKAENEDL